MYRVPRGLIGLCLAALLALVPTAGATAAGPWVIYEGGEGPGKGKSIVLISGDEEYRSEDALPQLGKVLAKHHGFRCTVLFAIDPETGTIDPNRKDNIPGLEALDSADLMIVFTRFRDLPDEQMKHIADYIESGRPVIGLRTATHAFALNGKSPYQRFSHNFGKDWPGGFGKQVLGETWVNHHGSHGHESTRGLIAPGQEKHPILKGLKDGDIWGPTDVYTVHLPLEHCTPLVMGQVLTGMSKDDPPVEGKKNDPMMPVAWIKTYTGKSGAEGRVFTTTMGSSQDLATAGTRRMLVNAAFWAVGLEDRVTDALDVSLVGEYKPLPFRPNGFEKGRKPADHEMQP